MIKPIIYWQAPGTKNKIIDALQNNKVLATTTDTIPGLLANTTELGFATLNAIKGGRQNKPYIILISDASKLDHFVQPEHLTPDIKKLIERCWPGPLTIVFKAIKDLPNFLTSTDGTSTDASSTDATIAIRCPRHTELLAVLKHFDGLYSTSANRSATPAPATIDAIDESVASQVAYRVDTSVVDTSVVDTLAQKVCCKPSTIIDVANTCVSNTHMRIVREGAYSIHDLEKILGKI